MSRVKDGNFVVIQSFMVKSLHLKGNELLLYAIIYGFSQDDQQRFGGSLQYLADWTNCTRQAVQANLKSLCSKGLLQKFEAEKNGVKFCEYRAINLRGVQNYCTPMQNNCTGGVQKSCTGGVQKNCTNNIYNNNINNNIYNNPDDDDLRPETKTDSGSVHYSDEEWAALQKTVQDQLRGVVEQYDTD